MEPALFAEDISERNVAIVGSELVENYTVYIIEVTDGLHRWTVKHRYSDFHELHEKLTAENKVDRRLLPPKKILGKNSKSLVERRQKDLEQYLQTLLLQFPQATPPPLSCFLHLQLYEINGITAALAEELFHKGEQLLQAGQVFSLRPLQLYSVTQQLRLAKPTCFTGDTKTDLGHILDFTCRLKYLKISGTREPVGSSNIQEKILPFDLSIFKSLLQIEICECSSQQISGLLSLRKTLATMSVHHSTDSMALVLVPEASEFPQWEPEGAVSVCPVTAVVPVWRSLTTLDLSHNNISAVDSSVKLIPKVEFLDLSHNQLTSVENLQHLYSLVHVDLSFNCLCSLDAAHTRLGNIKTLGLSGNQLSSLQGLSKLYSLVNLDLSRNQLAQLEEIRNIGSLPCLEKLNLTDNPMCIIPDYRTKVLAQFGDRAAEVCLDGKTTTEKELDTVEVLKAIQKAKEVKDRKNNSSSTEKKLPALPSQVVTSSTEETAVAPSVLPKMDAGPSSNIPKIHTTLAPASVDQIQTQGEHCGAPSAPVCCFCSPPTPYTPPSCFFCNAPFCPLLPSQLLSLCAHKDFISQLSFHLSSALNEDTGGKEAELQREEEPIVQHEKTELNKSSPSSRDGYFEMGLDDSLEESSSTALPVTVPSLPVEEVQWGVPCEQVEVRKAIWCICLQVKSEEEEMQLNTGCLVMTEHVLGLFFLSHDFSLIKQDTDPIVLLPRVVSSLQKPLLLPLSDLQLGSDQDQSCLRLRCKSSDILWVLFSDQDELRVIRAELIKLLQMDPESLSDPIPGLPLSLLNSWEMEESRSAEGGFMALLFLFSPSSSELHPLLLDLFSPAPLLPCLLLLSNRQLYVWVPDYRDHTGPGLQQSSSRLVRFPLGSVIVHRKDQSCCCNSPQHRLRWSHSVQLLLCGQTLLLLFPLPHDGASFQGKLSLRRASLEGVRIVALPQTWTSRIQQCGLRSREQCCCSQITHSDSFSSLSISVEENQPSPHLTPGLSPGLKLLSRLNSQQLQSLFHKHVALTDGEELRQVLWLSVVLYKSPEIELTCLLLLSSNAIYFLLEDSASSLGPPSDLEVLECADPSVCLCCCLSISLSHIQSVNVGLFDQYFRIVGSSGDQVVCCLSRDSYGTGQFLQELMSVLSLQQGAPPPEPSEQDFYSQFNCSGKMQNYEMVHSCVKFIYPSEEEMGDLTFIVAERKNGCASSSRSFNILLYLLVFQVLPQSSASSGSGPVPSSSSGPILQPRTLILTSTDVFLLDEDYVSYPLPDFAKEPPSRERYHLREARRIRDLDRVLLGYQTYPQALTLVFDELPGPDLLCPLSIDHFSAQATPTEPVTPALGGGARCPGSGAYSGEVQWCVFVPSADSRERLISLLARQWEMLCSRELPVELTG
ncbi:nischarin isoform X1 [Periophthalmus magnuspinnatus]|uniref:nischarin isoform X1 n=1 Tax=Periophthalmus magnuspinnatus TaxID=409849 RepID=UPI00145B1203|nr:nischarin isoform X1 [Periophthalmus magnuspinnatus]